MPERVGGLDPPVAAVPGEGQLDVRRAAHSLDGPLPDRQVPDVGGAAVLAVHVDAEVLRAEGDALELQGHQLAVGELELRCEGVQALQGLDRVRVLGVEGRVRDLPTRVDEPGKVVSTGLPGFGGGAEEDESGGLAGGLTHGVDGFETAQPGQLGNERIFKIYPCGGGHGGQSREIGRAGEPSNEGLGVPF